MWLRWLGGLLCRGWSLPRWRFHRRWAPHGGRLRPFRRLYSMKILGEHADHTSKNPNHRISVFGRSLETPWERRPLSRPDKVVRKRSHARYTCRRKIEKQGAKRSPAPHPERTTKARRRATQSGKLTKRDKRLLAESRQPQAARTTDLAAE